jgi:RNA polymerase sigma-70 factor (ECF subfamily)
MSHRRPTIDPGGSPKHGIDWASVLLEHERWLRTVVAARLGEDQAVDEVWQEISLAAVATKVAIDPSRVAGWLYRLATRKTLLHRRTMGRRHKLTGRYAEKVRDEETPPPDPLGWLLLDERSTLIREALGTLPGRDAEILLLKYTENWSCRDLAEHLGQTEAAIESRLHRARQRLRDALAGSSVLEVRR